MDLGQPAGIGLQVWTRGDERAPHKPLLLLYALGRCSGGSYDGRSVITRVSWRRTRVSGPAIVRLLRFLTVAV
jgi:hypothetical protein